MMGNFKFVMASEAWPSRQWLGMTQALEPSPNWTAASQAPRSDRGWTAASQVHAFSVMASEAWPSLLTGSQTLGLGVLGLVCQRGVA
jgi:hypothetical protein